jgi:hypothetical protein
MRFGLRLAIAVVGASLLSTAAFVVVTMHSRLFEYAEGCVLFEAARLHAHLALYVDPISGAYDYGAVPARYYVVYPPFWVAALSLIPSPLAPDVGRCVSSSLWYGVLGGLARSALLRGRPVGALVAAFFGGVYTLALYAASARPDSLAVALAAIALEKSVRRGRMGSFEAGLFALAACIKPNVFGLGVGAFGALVLSHPRGIGKPVCAWIGVLVTVAALLHWLSHGEWIHHLVFSTLQTWSLAQWVYQLRASPQFLALPLAFAVYCGRARHSDAGARLATLALLASLGWTLFALGKVGSATNYWMEPCMGAVVVCAHVPVPSLSVRAKCALALAVPLQALWMGVASVRSSLESMLASPAQARILAEVRGSLRPGEVALSDNAGIEFALDGRLVDEPFQATRLIQEGRFSRELWIADVERPEVAALVTESDILERPLAEVDFLHDRYDTELRRALRSELELVKQDAGLYVYRCLTAPR